MNNLNSYNKDQFKQTFKRTEIYKKLILDFNENNLIWDKFFLLSSSMSNEVNLNNNISKISQTEPLRETLRSSFSNKFSASIFYYLMPLIEHEYTTIYDLGCGKNMFKPYIPNLIGVGAEEACFVKNYKNIKQDADWPDILTRDDFTKLPQWIQDECIHQHNLNLDAVPFYGDIHGVVDNDYIETHQNYFESVFSICALHFHPIDQFCKIVEDFSLMVKSGGCGFLALNLQRMIDFSKNELLISLFGSVSPTKNQLDQYIRNELDKIDLNWLIIDVDLTLINEGLDGNIRLVFKK
jgi:hypothetical protein